MSIKQPKRNYSQDGLEEFIDVDEFTALITADLSEDIMGAFTKQSGYAATYSVKAASARRQAADIDLIVKMVNAKLTKLKREQLTKAERELAEDENRKIEKITVDMVASEVMLDPAMIKWLQMQIDADEIRAVCNAAADAFRTRSEMLKGLGHLTSAQMKTNVQIQSAQSAAQSYKARRAARRGEGVDEAAE
jgi:hypothetical protein